MKSVRRAVTVVAAGVLAAVVPGAAFGSDYLFWVVSDSTMAFPSYIGRANLDGSDIRSSLIPNAGEVWGLGATATQVYWWKQVGFTSSLARADVSGSGVTGSVAALGLSPQYGMGISGTNAYFISSGVPNRIGRVGLDGSGLDTSLGVLSGFGIGTAAGDGHVFWGVPGAPNAIGRAALDGTGINSAFVSPAAGVTSATGQSIAVGANYIYWTNTPANAIGRVGLDGSSPDATFITGASNPQAVAVSGSHIYWSNATTRTIGRAALDGTGVNQSFIATGAPMASDLLGLAVSETGSGGDANGGSSGGATGGSTPESTNAATGTPALSATVVIPRRRLASGRTMKVGIRAANTGTASATAVTSCLRLPAGLVITRANGATRTGRTACFAVGTLAAGATASKTLTVRAEASSAATRTVTGTVRADGIAATATANAPKVRLLPVRSRAVVVG